MMTLPRLIVAQILLAVVMLGTAATPALSDTATFLSRLQPLVPIYQRTQLLMGNVFESDNVLAAEGLTRADRIAEIETRHARYKAEGAALRDALGRYRVDESGLDAIEADFLDAVVEKTGEMLSAANDHMADQMSLVQANGLTALVERPKFAAASMMRRLSYIDGQIAFLSAVQLASQDPLSSHKLLVDINLQRADREMIAQLFADLDEDGATGPDADRGRAAAFQRAVEAARAALDTHEGEVFRFERAPPRVRNEAALEDIIAIHHDIVGLYRQGFTIYERYRTLIWTEDGIAAEPDPAKSAALDQELGAVGRMLSQKAVAMADAAAALNRGPTNN